MHQLIHWGDLNITGNKHLSNSAGIIGNSTGISTGPKMNQLIASIQVHVVELDLTTSSKHHFSNGGPSELNIKENTSL